MGKTINKLVSLVLNILISNIRERKHLEYIVLDNSTLKFLSIYINDTIFHHFKDIGVTRTYK